MCSLAIRQDAFMGPGTGLRARDVLITHQWAAPVPQVLTSASPRRTVAAAGRSLTSGDGVPHSHQIDRATGVVYTRAWGVLTDEDLTGIRVARTAVPAYRPEPARLYDLSEVTNLQLSSRAILQQSLATSEAPNARRAIVVPSEVAYGMSRMFAILSGRDALIQVFRDRASAMQWITRGE